MPTGTAISTTKRKFHKILDSISNASSTSLNTKLNHDKYNNASTTTLPAAIDPPAKRPRTARPASAYVPPSSRILISQSPNLRPAAAAAPQPTPVTTMNQERKTPNFAPWDRGQFLERLKTYRHVDKWMGKPESINEVQWAKRGWSCVGKERVGCVGGCGKEVVITLESSREEREETGETQDVGKRPADEEEDEDEWREKAQVQLVEKYAEMVVTSHDSGCLWRRKGCDDTIQRLPLAHHKTAMDDLRQRYHSLVAIASELPPDPFPPPGLNLLSLSQHLSPLLPPPSPADHPPSTTTPNSLANNNNNNNNNNTTTPINTSALALALTGWQAEPDHVIGLATCTACFRRLGLWLFKPSSSSFPSPSPSDSTLSRLDLISEHRTHCPWVNPLAQNGSFPTTTQQQQQQQQQQLTSPSLERPSGWETLLRAVNGHKRHRAENEDTKSEGTAVRKALNDKHDNDDDDDDNDDVASEEVSVAESSSVVGTGTRTGTGPKGEDLKRRDERDRERWAKLKRLKQAFHVNARRKWKGKGIGKGDADAAPDDGAGKGKGKGKDKGKGGEGG